MLLYSVSSVGKTLQWCDVLGIAEKAFNTLIICFRHGWNLMQTFENVVTFNDFGDGSLSICNFIWTLLHLSSIRFHLMRFECFSNLFWSLLHAKYAQAFSLFSVIKQGSVFRGESIRDVCLKCWYVTVRCFTAALYIIYSVHRYIVQQWQINEWIN